MRPTGSEPAAQLLLDLGWQQGRSRGDFHVGAANADAAGWIDRWPDWPSGALVLEGPAGAGKSHLAAVWQTRAAARLIEGVELDTGHVRELAARPVPTLVEHADRADELALLQLYNVLMERAMPLLLTARTPPARWGTALPDLASRLRALPVASIKLPDDTLLRDLLTKLLIDRGIRAPAEVLDFVLPRIERSFVAAWSLALDIDHACATERRTLTVPLVRDLLASRSLDPDARNRLA